MYRWGLFLAMDIWCTFGDYFWLWTFGVPLGIVSGWWDDRKRNHKPVRVISLPSLGYSNNLSRALSCLRLSGHNFLNQRMQRTT